jgi:hypothetical protein
MVDKAKAGGKAFTKIELLGMPTREEAAVFARKLEETYIPDLCEIHIGRTSEDVPDTHGIFGDSPVFVMEKGGWQERYISIIRKLGQSHQTQGRPSFDRPPWIVRLVCKKEKMFQARISPANIAMIIEERYNNYRAIPSDFYTGLIDVYVTLDGKGAPGDEPQDRAHSELQLEVKPQLRGISLQSVIGFSKTLVEKYSITRFISRVTHSQGGHVVEFSSKDIRYNGVPLEQLDEFVRYKAGKDVQVEVSKDGLTFTLKGFVGNLHAHLIALATIKLEDAVKEVKGSGKEGGMGGEERRGKGGGEGEERSGKEEGKREGETEERDTFKIALNRDFLRVQNGVAVESLVDFFAKQNELKTFESVEIGFDRNTFVVTIGRASGFTPEGIVSEFKRFNISDNIETTADSIIFNNVKDTGDLERFQIAVESYSRTLVTVTKPKERKITLTLYPLHFEAAWSLLVNVNTGCQIIPTTFVAQRWQRLSERYRILARGIGLDQLAFLPFVNIYATISSTPMEHFEVFGIEAARKYIMNELATNAGSNVGNRHLSLIADAMTYVGQPIKVKLSGKRATMAGAIATASMEQSLKLLLDSSLANAQDELKSAAGMTFIGDFDRGSLPTSKREEEEKELESVLSSIFDVTPKVRTRGKKEVEKKSKPPVVVVAGQGDDPLASFVDERGGL